MSSCACQCDVDGVADVYEASWRVARKEHHCCECHEPIAVGQRYEYASVCYDGSWSHAKTCELCARIRDDLCRGVYAHGELRDTIWYCLDFDYLTGEERPPSRCWKHLTEESA